MDKNTYLAYALTGDNGMEIYGIRMSENRASAVQLVEWSDRKEHRGVDLCSPFYPNLMIGSFLASYLPSGEDRNPDLASGGKWGAVSPTIHALFATWEEAREAFDGRSRVGNGKEWEESTNKVLRSLGTSHHQIYILTDSRGALKQPRLQAA